MADRELSGNLFARMFRGGAARLRSKTDEVNQLNVFPVPDGDTGDNMSMTMEGGIKALDDVNTDDIGAVAESVSGGMLMGARGNSGVILSQFFAGIASVLSGKKTADVEMVGQALLAGVDKAYSSVLTPTEGTILTVARESVQYAVSRITNESTVNSLFADLATEADDSVQRTPEALAILKEAGVVDSGGSGLKYIIEGFLRILRGEDVDLLESLTQKSNSQSSNDVKAPGPDFVLTHGYCTELLLQLTNSKTDIESFDMKPITEWLQAMGDSIVAIKTGSLVKVHVHTKEPYKILEYFHSFGEFVKLKIENMSLQHRDMETGEDVNEEETKKVKKTYAIVAVANGAGIEELFRSLRADEIVSGGQTMNPSAQDFLDAFNQVNKRFDTENIIVFPNNSNIIMAAKQAADMYKDAHVYVVESKSVGDGYAAMSVLDPDTDDMESNVAMASDMMSQVQTVSLTTAVRDSEMNGISVHAGEYIGVGRKEILAADKSLLNCAIAMLEKIGAEDADVINIIVGADASSADSEAVHKAVEEKFQDADIYEMQGGQAVYPFIFVIQ